jgi:acetolactate decarboxylase
VKILRIAVLFFILFIAVIILSEKKPMGRDVLYQVSVLDGLVRGDYGGKLTLRQIRSQGDFGLGTFDNLDGEAVLLDGVFYQIGTDLIARRPCGNLKSPFAMVTFFDNDLEFPIAQKADYRLLQDIIDSRLATKNIPYAIKVEGKFSFVKVRSVPAQLKPYLALTEVVKAQKVAEFYDIEGVLVGFRLPDYMQGVNMPGYHMHFLSLDKAKGCHVLDVGIISGKVKIDDTDSFMMVLPGSADFFNMKFSSKTDESVLQVESNR